MKFISVSSLNFYLVFIFCFLGCKKEKQDESLPPELRQELNCYINGKYWTMKPGGNCHKLNALYAQDSGIVGDNPSGFLNIGGKDCDTDNSLGFSLYNVSRASSYDLAHQGIGAVYKDIVNATEGSRDYVYDSLLAGTVRILELIPPSYREEINPDTGQPVYHKINGWIEGTFEMTLINDISLDSNNTQHDTLKITDGKFAVIL